jgi:hypothetical protein
MLAIDGKWRITYRVVAQETETGEARLGEIIKLHAHDRRVILEKIEPI